MNSSADKLVSIVRESVHEIDPYGLLEGGAPIDEFDSEILAIAGKISRCRSPEEIAEAIAEVLNKSFSDEFTPHMFSKEADHLFTRLKQASS